MKKIINNKYLIIFLMLIVIDQIVKFIMQNYLSKEVIVIDNFFSFNLVYNKGAAWNIFNNQVIFIMVISIVCLIILYQIQKSLNMQKTNIIFTFIYAGAVGNFIDRLFRGYVVDFLDFKIFGYDFPVFNLADIFLVLGFISLIIYIAFFSEKEEE